MTLKLQLTPDLETALAEQARRKGTTLELLALESLRDRFVIPEPTATVPDQTLADFLSDHLGVLASSEQVPGGARMSEATGRKFAAGLVRKRQQNKL
jgi:hypothetical protein